MPESPYNPPGFHEVSRDDFFAAMNPLDVHPHPRGKYNDPDARTEWIPRYSNRVIGVSVRGYRYPYNMPLHHTHYFLPARPARP